MLISYDDDMCHVLTSLVQVHYSLRHCLAVSLVLCTQKIGLVCNPLFCLSFVHMYATHLFITQGASLYWEKNGEIDSTTTAYVSSPLRHAKFGSVQIFISGAIKSKSRTYLPVRLLRVDHVHLQQVRFRGCSI